jgi:hypothetical protein
MVDPRIAAAQAAVSEVLDARQQSTVLVGAMRATAEPESRPRYSPAAVHLPCLLAGRSDSPGDTPIQTLKSEIEEYRGQLATAASGAVKKPPELSR